MASSPPPTAEERVLSTLNRDGTRRWIRPRLSEGRFLTRRRIVGWGLILLFTAIPYLRMNGKPLMLLDVPRRQFVLFGTTFLPIKLGSHPVCRAKSSSASPKLCSQRWRTWR